MKFVSVWCNQSGGSAIGSLSDGTAIENVIYRNIYTNGGNQAFMIKSNLGSGYVRNVLFDSFISRGTAYGLDINQYWSSQSPGSGAGVQLSNITFSVRLHNSSREAVTEHYCTGICTGIELER